VAQAIAPVWNDAAIAPEVPVRYSLPTLALAVALALVLPPSHASADEPRFGIVVHGGAGTISREKLTPELEQQYRETLDAAMSAGYAVLQGGGSSLDAVEVTLVLLEDSPLFNAGKGAVFTHAGTNEMDASIMDGATGAAGAVGGVTRVRNPIRAARAVMTRTRHVLLVGPGADHFAEEAGLDLEPPEYFRTDRRWEQLQRAIEREGIELDHGSDTPEVSPATDKHGTVGAVALDREGNLAAATSTGGLTNKRWGRVGDSPIVGAGTYADNETCAVSCTGHGEYFIREAVAHSVAARMEFAGQSLGDAAAAVIGEQLDPIGGTGGLIALDRQLNVAMPYNTGGMYRGMVLSDGRHEVRIWED
jgi:L-asparaginase / beta-aspartyl-peptidase